MNRVRSKPQRVSARVLIESLEARQLFSAAAAVHDFVATPNFHLSPAITNATPTGYTPTQIRHAYGFDNITFSNGTITGTGAGQTIAIVDAYDDPNIAADLAVFSTKYNLPQMDGKNGHPTFTAVKPAGRVQTDAGWALEIALDVEWAHAIAPQANIVLVEAKSSSLSNLLSAVDTARKRSGVVAVSMSWGGSEFSSESSYDSYFTTPAGHVGVTFVASSGDNGAPVSWPAVSPNVLSVGGTTLTLDSAGNRISETGWSGSGGGISAYEAKPSYQSSLAYSRRSNPDLAYDADPATGFPVYDSISYQGQSGWFQVGGTSAGAPQIAALIAIADQGRATVSKPSLNGRNQVLPALYTMPASVFYDVTGGSSAGSPSYSATSGYDLVTGLGSAKADSFVQQLLIV